MVGKPIPRKRGGERRDRFELIRETIDAKKSIGGGKKESRREEGKETMQTRRRGKGREEKDGEKEERNTVTTDAGRRRKDDSECGTVNLRFSGKKRANQFSKSFPDCLILLA